MNYSALLYLVAILSLMGASAPDALSASYGLNDVTVLLPLPEPPVISELIAPADQGTKGPLLPKEVYLRFPALDSSFDAQSLYDHNFKVIGVRIDPCFAEGTSTACRRQMRLVWQPLIENGGNTTTLDAAVHTFYEFSESEWNSLLVSWSGLVKGNLTESLQVHPTLKREGYSGSTWTLLKKLIIKSCGNANLVRVTGMRVSAARMWSFLGFDKVGTTWTKMGIPHTQSTVQSFILFSDGMLNLKEFQGTLSPPPQDDLALVGLVTNSREYKRKQPEEVVKSLMQKNVQFENPKLHNPGTVDCVSCHMTQTVLLWGQKNYGGWDWMKDFAKDRFTSTFNLKNESVNAFNSNRVRAFGYFDEDPIFSQRVINESAVVATALSQ